MEIKQFEAFFNDYYIPLLQYCLSIVRQAAEAEDIVQQAFVTLWTKRESINIHTSARAYLYKTVYNSSLDFLKHETVKKRYVSRESENYSVFQIDPAVTNELAGKIDVAIKNLPEQCRKVFCMSRFENKKYRDIAIALDLSEKTVENHMGKALKLLRESLKDLLILFFLLNT